MALEDQMSPTKKNINQEDDIRECQTTDGQKDVDHLEIAERTVNFERIIAKGFQCRS